MEKCAHDACRCQVEQTGAYCSDHCRSMSAAGPAPGRTRACAAIPTARRGRTDEGERSSAGRSTGGPRGPGREPQGGHADLLAVPGRLEDEDPETPGAEGAVEYLYENGRATYVGGQVS